MVVQELLTQRMDSQGFYKFTIPARVKDLQVEQDNGRQWNKLLKQLHYTWSKVIVVVIEPL